MGSVPKKWQMDVIFPLSCLTFFFFLPCGMGNTIKCSCPENDTRFSGVGFFGCTVKPVHSRIIPYLLFCFVYLWWDMIRVFSQKRCCAPVVREGARFLVDKLHLTCCTSRRFRVRAPRTQPRERRWSSMINAACRRDKGAVTSIKTSYIIGR